MILAEAATQPATQLWTNITAPQALAYLAALAAVWKSVTAGIEWMKNWTIDQWFGTKKLIHEKQAELDRQLAEIKKRQQILAQASSASDVKVTPEIKAKVNEIASGDGTNP